MKGCKHKLTQLLEVINDLISSSSLINDVKFSLRFLKSNPVGQIMVPGQTRHMSYDVFLINSSYQISVEVTHR